MGDSLESVSGLREACSASERKAWEQTAEIL